MGGEVYFEHLMRYKEFKKFLQAKFFTHINN